MNPTQRLQELPTLYTKGYGQNQVEFIDCLRIIVINRAIIR